MRLATVDERRGGVTNDDTVLREVDEAMAEDRQREFLEKNGSLLIAGGAAIVMAVAGWQLWKGHERSQAEQAAVEFSTAVKTLADTPEDGRVALTGIAETAPEGYALLAEMRRAASLAGSDRQAALAIYRKIYADGGAPKRLRDLARLRAASLAFPDGRDAVVADLGSLEQDKSQFGFYAKELAALAALQAKDYAAAEEKFSALSTNPQAPGPVRQRADEFTALAAAGKAGVNITGEARVDDLLKALGETKEGDASKSGDDSGGGEAPDQAAGGDDSGGDADKAATKQNSATGEDQ